MSDFNLENLDALHYDILREIGNIGSGNATTALSQLINKRVDMGVPKVQLLDFNQVPELLGGAEEIVTGTLFTFDGDIEGMIMLVTPTRVAHEMVSLLMPVETDMEGIEFSEMELSALREIGNILSGAYMASFSMLTNLNALTSVPYLSIDMAGAIFSVPAIEFGKLGEKVLIIETGFGEEKEKVNGFFILIPTLESYGKIMKSLGIQ